jgi:23S rRNA (uracil1939-C5)-methyltransferase
VLDPPRAGAFAQVKQLSSAGISRIAYVSCDAASFARDARILIDGGFRLDWLVGVDQFLWSAHVEIAAAFSRK